MDNNTKAVIDKRINKTIENLKKNNMQAFYAENKAEALKKVAELLKDGDAVTTGGSRSLVEAGVLELLKNGNYEFLDRYAKGLTKEESWDIFRLAFTADVYLTGSNAITENGELYNVDGNGNRVSAMIFGPKSVIVVAGYNKIVKNIDEAIARVKNIAAPANCQRINANTYCYNTGYCQSSQDKNSEICDGCKTQDRICCSYVILALQKVKDRIKVILVGEELGY